MTEAVVEEVATEVAVDQDVDQETSQKEPEQTTQQPSSAESRAIEQGWKPQDQFVGDPDKWVDAKEFLRRGELFEKIDSLGRELKDTKKVLTLLKQHHEKVRVTEYQNALADLKAQKKAAYETGDVDQIVELDEKISDFKAQAKAEETAAQQQAAQPNPQFVAWVQKNSWYAQDAELRTFADDVGMAHARAHPDKSPGEVLKYVEERVRKAYSDRFTNPNRTKPGAVEGNSTPRTSKRDDFQLDDEETKVMQKFVKQGVMTKEEYISQLKAIKGIK